MTQYDNTDRGALFPPRDNHKMILTGKANDDGVEKHIVLTKSTLPDGRNIIDVYEKTGTLFENDKKGNESAPDYTGPLNGRRVAAWRKNKDGMNYMSINISDKKQGAGNQRTNQSNSEDIPF